MEQVFLDLIEAEPAETMHRLIYADWLEGQGDPLFEVYRYATSKKELDRRLVLVDWGFPEEVAAHAEVMETGNVVWEHKNWGLQSNAASMHLFHDETPFEDKHEPFDPYGTLVCHHVMDSGLDQSSVHRADLMPPGWVGHDCKTK